MARLGFGAAAARKRFHRKVPQQAAGIFTSASILDDDFQRAIARNWLGRTLYTDLANYLPDDRLVKIDRMSMANSLEVRGPYLDPRLVEFAVRLHSHAKVFGFSQKRLLRGTFADVLP